MSSVLASKISLKSAEIAIIGLGFVGLSLMEAFGKQGFRVKGFDRNKHKIEKLHKNQSYLSGASVSEINQLLIAGKCRVSDEPSIVEGADVFIITVPTSLDPHGLPDLSKVKSASHLIEKHLKKDSLVIMQSTSYPGTTEEDILKILEQSRLEPAKDFHLAFIPEISDFGSEKFTFAQIPKILGGLTSTCAQLAASLYKHITEEVTIVSSAKIAEAAKILQNTYRLVNISLINEMKIMFDKMGIDIWEVIEAAKKKPFGFTPFYPGPGIGGDCIPVDPVYLIWKAKEFYAPTTMIERAIQINDSMTDFVTQKVIFALNEDDRAVTHAKVLVLGASFKKDVNDIRQSCSLKILPELIKHSVEIEYHDPFIEKIFLPSVQDGLVLSSIDWKNVDLSSYDCVLILVDHTFYDWSVIGKNAKRIVDTRNILDHFPEYRHKVVKA